MAQIRRSITLDERRAKATAWALTFADMVTLLLTFFVLLLVILNDAEEHIDRVINQLLDETYEELRDNVASSHVSVDRVTKGIKITMRGKLFKSMSADVDPKVRHPFFYFFSSGVCFESLCGTDLVAICM